MLEHVRLTVSTAGRFYKDGVPIIAYSPVNWKCVTWDFNHLEGDTYQLRNLFTGKTFQPVQQQPADGDGLIQQPLAI